METAPDYSLLNKKLDPSSSFWKKKYTLILKRAEGIEKQNVRLINRLYHSKKIYRRLWKEKSFLMRRLDLHGDDYQSTKFFSRTELLPEGTMDYEPPTNSKNIITKAKSNSHVSLVRTKKNSHKMTSSNQNLKDIPPKKPLNAFLRYFQAQRENVLKENPGITNQDLTKMLSKQWNSLDELEKESYYELFDQDRVRYEQELEAYKTRRESVAGGKISTNTEGDLVNDIPVTTEVLAADNTSEDSMSS